MNILQVHNFYRQPGGEDQVYAAEYELLTRYGHAVSQYSVHNDSLVGISRLGNAGRAIWNSQSYRQIAALVEEKSVDIIHAHNTFPIVSPSLYYAAAAHGVPVVQTVQNFRLLCPAATLFRDGAVCEKCVGAAIPYHAVLHRCYKHSASASAAVASMLLVHRIAGTWSTKVATYIAATNFAKAKFIEGGLPASKIAVKPNFLANDPGLGEGNGGYTLFAGRLTEEKGLVTLLDAWERLSSQIPLKIAGDGPLAPIVKQRADRLANVEWLGYCDRERILRLLKDAALLIFPSLWYEGLPMIIVEALACGTPVAASALGAMNELIEDGINGIRFIPGDVNDLVTQVRSIWAQSDILRAMRRSTRRSYDRNYTPEWNYELLMQIYAKALHRV
ncbi:MAG: glycosyltransferase [Bryobacteraceae bacterium]